MDGDHLCNGDIVKPYSEARSRGHCLICPIIGLSRIRKDRHTDKCNINIHRTENESVKVMFDNYKFHQLLNS